MEFRYTLLDIVNKNKPCFESIKHTVINFARIVLFIAGLINLEPYLVLVTVYDYLNVILFAAFFFFLLIEPINYRLIALLGMTISYNKKEYVFTNFEIPVINFSAYKNADYEILLRTINDPPQMISPEETVTTFLSENHEISKTVLFSLSIIFFLMSKRFELNTNKYIKFVKETPRYLLF